MGHGLREYSEGRYLMVEFPELHRAATVGDHATLRACIERGDDVNRAIRIPHAWHGGRPRPTTPLTLAAGSEWGATAETVELLLEAGANPIPRSREYSAAESAVAGWYGRFIGDGCADRLSLVIAAGAPLPKDEESLARLVSHAAEHNVGVLRVLLDAGVSPHPYSQFLRDWDPKAHARDFGLEDDEEDVRPPPGPYTFQSPIHSAAIGGDPEAIDLLLERGASLHVLDESGHNVLTHARSVAAVEHLVELDPRLAEKVDLEECFYDFTDEFLRPVEVTKAAFIALVRAALDSRTPPDTGKLVESAAFARNPVATKALIEEGVEFARDGHTALHALSWHDEWCEDEIDQEELTNFLIDAGIDPSAREDERGNTALHEAMAGDGMNVPIARALIAAGVDVNVRNDQGETPLHCLYSDTYGWGAEKAVPFLLELGANPNLADHEGFTVLDLARDLASYKESFWRRAIVGAKIFFARRSSVPSRRAEELRALLLLEEASHRFPEEE